MMRRVFFFFPLLLVIHTATAKDERSIKDLSKALTALASNVDPAEARAGSVTAHTTARKRAHEYRVVLNPEFTVCLVNVGKRKRTWGAHVVQGTGHRRTTERSESQDSGARLGRGF